MSICPTCHQPVPPRHSRPSHPCTKCGRLIWIEEKVCKVCLELEELVEWFWSHQHQEKMRMQKRRTV